VRLPRIEEFVEDAESRLERASPKSIQSGDPRSESQRYYSRLPADIHSVLGKPVAKISGNWHDAGSIAIGLASVL